ncbi:MAG: Ger(x)C family spore germination protein [Thermovenabulum sp.]|uniref:Ger(x)C family spore germination protein n=1 Tax=Thermovenabulum sp. TaxID=3100335 RepID=UPI003C7BB591
MKKFIRVSIIITLLFFLSGCWDMVDIDKRIFIGNVGIDKKEDKYLFTFTYPIVRKLVGGEGGGGGGGQGKNIYVIKTEARSLTEAISLIAHRTSRRINFDHSRNIIIGEELARDGIKEIIDSLERNPQTNRRSYLIIAKDRAEKILSKENDQEILLAYYIEYLFKSKQNPGDYVDRDFSEVMEQIHSLKGDALMPVITVAGKDLDANGGAVIKDYRLIGYLNTEEVRGINILLGKAMQTITAFDIDGTKLAVCEIKSARSTPVLLKAQEVPVIRYDIEVAASLREIHSDKIGKRGLKELQEGFAKEIKKQIEAGLNRVQKDYKVDVIGVGEYLYKRKPKIWEKYEKDWEEIFPDVEIIVNPKVKFINLGPVI